MGARSSGKPVMTRRSWGWSISRRCHESEPIKDVPRNGRSRAVGKLIKGAVTPKALEGLLENCCHGWRRHEKQRKAAHHRACPLATDGRSRFELRCVDAQDTRLRKLDCQLASECLALFDQREARLRNAALE